jgi:outer membrane protein TolC
LGSIGLSATSLGNSNSTLSWGVGPNLVWNIFDRARLSNQILVQDARFQQLYEQHQEVVLQAAREVDNAAVGIAKNQAQIPLLTDAKNAAQRSLDIANIQYREGLVDFERVLDSQRALFNQQERLVSSRGDATQDLITLYKAMGGGWQQGRHRPILDETTKGMMLQRSDWKNILNAPLPPPESNSYPNVDKTEQ